MKVTTTATKKQKADQPKERVNTAVYITSLPDDVDVEELHQVFSRYGVIAESLDSDAPRIKLYTDDQDNFKGEALIGMYLHLRSPKHSNARSEHHRLPKKTHKLPESSTHLTRVTQRSASAGTRYRF